MARLYERYSWTLPPLGIALGVRVLLLFAAQIIMRLIPGQPVRGLLTIWRRWDANWYLSIVEHGYQYPTSFRSNVNFFPLYPITIWIGQHILNPLFGDRGDLIAAMAISWITFAIACVILYRMVSQRFDQHVALLTITLLATFPFSFYYGAVYTESLYLLLAVVAFYGIEKHAWWLAGAAALLAGAVRPNGFVVGACVVLAYGLEWLQKRRPLRWDVLALGLTPLGLGAYLVYCWLRFGQPLAYLEASRKGWRTTGLSLNTINDFISLLLHPGNWFVSRDIYTIIWTIYALILIAALIGLVYVYRILGPVYAFFTLANIAIPVLNLPAPNSLARYISVIFPLFIVLALAVRNRPTLQQALTIGFTIFLTTFALLFVMNFPVY